MILTILAILAIVIGYTYLYFYRISLAILVLFASSLLESFVSSVLDLPVVELQSAFYLSLGKFHIYLADIFLVSFLTCFVISFLKGMRAPFSRGTEIRWLSIYGCIIGIGIIVGWRTFHTDAIVDSRPIVYSLGTILALGSRETSIEDHKKILNSIFIISILYLAMAYLRWFELLPRPQSLTSLGIGTWLAARVLNRSEAMFLIIGLWHIILSIIGRKKRINVFSICYLVCVFPAILFCNIRSIWIISTFGLFYLLFVYKISGAKVLKAALAFIAIIVFLYQVLTFTGKFADIQDASLGAIYYDEESTIYWRNIVSAAYLNHMAFENYLFGTAFGNTPVIVFGRTAGTWGLHNNYVEVFYHGGIIGFILFYMVYFKTLYRLLIYRTKSRDGSMQLVSQFFVVNLLCYLIFSLIWTTDTVNAVLLGLSISFVNSNKGIK